MHRDILLAFLFPLCFAAAPLAAMPAFQYHAIPGPEDGNRESLISADIDKDGDLDFFTGGGRGDTSYWFENLGQAGWARHVVSDSDNADVGAAALDVDGDGWVDKVAGAFWYRNSGHPRDSAFTELGLVQSGRLSIFLVGAQRQTDRRYQYRGIQRSQRRWR